MKGSKPTNVTQTTVNPAQQAQQPYLNFGWGEAQNLYQNNPQSYYPGQTLSTFRGPSPWVTEGYQNLYGAGQNIDAGLGQYNQTYNNMAQYAPQIAGYAGQAAGNNNAGLNSLMQTAQGGGPGMEQLARTAGGYYLNSNPYMAAMVQAAQDPIARNYQTSVAPTIDAALTNSGRYGSGAQAGLYDASQQNLGRALGDVSTNLYGQQYAHERQAQDQAAQQYGALTNQAGNSYGQLYNSGLNLGLTGLGAAGDVYRNQAAAFPQWAQAQTLGAQTGLQAGQGLNSIDAWYRQQEQQIIDDQMKRYYGQQKSPWDNLTQYLGMVGQPTSGSNSQTTPYYSNQGANLLSGAAGIAGIGNNLGLWGGGSSAAGGLGGLGSLFGGAGLAGATLGGYSAAAPVAVSELSPMVAALFASDRRLKEDDKVVGRIGELPIHQFRYKGDSKQYLGFMADEVEKIDPAAVVDTDSGYKAVNYGQALGSALNSFMKAA